MTKKHSRFACLDISVIGKKSLLVCSLGAPVVIALEVASALAQNASQTLPPVTVDAPREKPQTKPRQQTQRPVASSARASSVHPSGPRPHVASTPHGATSAAPQVGPALLSGASGVAPSPPTGEIGNLPPAYAGGEVARGARLGMLGNRDFMDTPFNVTSYTSALIENQQARTLQQVLENDPSVRMTTSAGHIRENFRIRGFPVLGSELALNGMYGLAPDGHVPTEFLERVEVLKGPGALLNGMAPFGAVGGSINLVTKHAGDAPITSVSTDYTSSSQFGTHIDVGRRGGDHNQFGVRYNGVYRSGGTALDEQWKVRGLNALALDFREERIRLSIDAYHSQEIFKNGSALMASFSGIGVAAAPSATKNLFVGSNARFENKAIEARAELDIAENVTVFGGIGFLDSRNFGFTNGTQATGVNLLGNYSGARIVNLRGYTNSLSTQGGIRGQLDTGPLRHQFVLSASALKFSQSSEFGFISPYSSNIYVPVVPPQAPPPPVVPNTPFRLGQAYFATDPRKTGETYLASLAFADTISAFDERIQLIGGLRSQRVMTKTFQANTGIETNAYDSHRLSPAFALIVKPFDKRLSLYANYIEGLTQGLRVTNPLSTNYNESFAPFVSKQIETGAKLDLGILANTLSFYEITQPTLATVTTGGRVSYKPVQQRNQGIEWNVFGEPIPGVRVLGGVSYMIGVITQSADGKTTGKNAFGIPRWQANFYGEWDLPYLVGVTVEGRVIYTSALYVDSLNYYRIPEWARFDAGARYTTKIYGTDMTLRANVNNLFNHSYWSGAFNDGFATLDAPRTVLLSATFNF
ncbi:TonB-dependent siderophore receptor [Methylocystis sp. FS]|uniref:TonB-dependent siderophore receptor n=1 Tax=Methylocystis silviterrae TaxID=2743612 RepID=UPI0015844601|nr:TonB-dependent siderophore receptor [Methylocystis silviterrae]NUJ80623.1 TonB-dependent siderophore receptor [Methylocystis silviterrae]